MTKFILYVDDVSHGATVVDLLEEDGYSLMLYKKGFEAIDVIRNGLKYELALVDLSLPDVGGDRVMSESKEMNPSVPVFCISGWNYKPHAADKNFMRPILPSKLTKILDEHFGIKRK